MHTNDTLHSWSRPISTLGGQQSKLMCIVCVQTIRLVDALAVRIVTATDCRSMDVALEDVGKQISQIEAHLAPNNVQGLKHQVDTLRSQMQVKHHCSLIRVPVTNTACHAEHKCYKVYSMLNISLCNTGVHVLLPPTPFLLCIIIR